MQKYIHYKKWTGEITGHTREKSDCCIKVDIPKDNISDYMVFKDKLYKKDNIVRTQQEKELSIIEYGQKATVKLDIFPNEKILNIIIDKYFIHKFIDAYQLDSIQFLVPILKIYVHSKKASKLLGTLEIDLNEYIKTGKYEQDISTILSKVNVTDLIFKTHRCFEKYAYEIFENSAVIDRNLIDNDYHIKILRKANQILIQNNINYWNEFEDIKNYKFIISFFNKNRNYLEYYIPFVLQQLESRNNIIIDIPTTVNLTDTKIHINSNKLKIKYENTCN